VTLFAFTVFRRAGAEWVVYETGLGGRLDATNVLCPALSVITNIEREHTEFLGNTLEAIAAEKGGIIKAHTPVVVAAQPPALRSLFRRMAGAQGAPLFFVDDEVSVTENRVTRAGQRVCLRSGRFRCPIEVLLPMHGPFQAHNAALAALAAKLLYPDLDEQVIAGGLEAAQLPGRFQVIEHPAAFPGIPALVVEGAHTPASLAQVVPTFRELFCGDDHKPPALLFASAADKDAGTIAPLFAGFSPITLTRPGAARTADPEGLAAAFTAAALPHRYDDDYTQAIHAALEAASRAGQNLLAAGSFYLAGEVLRATEKDGLDCRPRVSP
jgi:dihydrofolate synthase/folylpolyglutamate synthase